MLGKTSQSAIRTLLLLGQQEPGACWSPRRLAETLGESPTYLAKVARHMVKQGLLEADKGAKGGVRLALRPEEITLLAVIEACQGRIVGDFCKSEGPPALQCGFHRAAIEMNAAVTGVLTRWSLARLLDNPAQSSAPDGVCCLMSRTNQSALLSQNVRANPLRIFHF